jgi:hypothetical protein
MLPGGKHGAHDQHHIFCGYLLLPLVLLECSHISFLLVLDLTASHPDDDQASAHLVDFHHRSQKSGLLSEISELGTLLRHSDVAAVLPASITDAAVVPTCCSFLTLSLISSPDFEDAGITFATRIHQPQPFTDSPEGSSLPLAIPTVVRPANQAPRNTLEFNLLVAPVLRSYAPAMHSHATDHFFFTPLDYNLHSPSG